MLATMMIAILSANTVFAKPSLTRQEVMELSNAELAIVVNYFLGELFDPKTDPQGTALYAITEAERRKLFTTQALLRAKMQRIKLGDPTFAVLAARGVPTHLENRILDNGKEIIGIYYYKSLLVLESRSAIFSDGKKIVGFAHMVQKDGRPMWRSAGLVPTGFWAPNLIATDLVGYPKNVYACTGNKKIGCIRYLELKAH
jgi:hypothetical protein